jgi:serine/threonine protein phosphatase PrpC
MMTTTLPAGAQLYFDQEMVASEPIAVAGGAACVYSARCPDKQTPNEDAAAVIPLGGQAAVLAVADGMGGAPVGERAAALAIRRLRSALEQAVKDGLMVRTAILNAIEKANQAVQEMGVGAATTLAVVELVGGTVRTYHVGDSMILVVGQRGKIKLQTISHSPVGFAVESGALDESEALHHEDRHLVSNVVGSAAMRIEVGAMRKLAPRDTLLLASDGLFDNLYTEEIVSRVRRGPIEKAVLALADEARGRMTQPTEGQPSKQDDLTFVVFRLRPPRRRRPPSDGQNAADSRTG